MNIRTAQINPQEPSRELDPHVLQRRASDPESSIWVSASAGTGKTKVLTDRVLRLLLPRGDGLSGTPAHKILGLTFTKAGANEMALRISQTLGHWAVMPEEDLQNSLQKLLGRASKAEEIKAARRLFAEVIDTPGRLKIMTIHSFCQSLLSRFPLEAGLTPGFGLIEDRQAADLLSDAKRNVIQEAMGDKSAPFYAALMHVSETVTEDQFNDLIRGIASERGQLQRILEANFGAQGLYTKLCQAMGVAPDQTARSLLEAACRDMAMDLAGLKNAARAISAFGTKSEAEKADILHQWLAAQEKDRPKLYEAYQLFYLKKDGDPRAKLVTKGVTDQEPQVLGLLEKEQARLMGLNDHMKAARMAALTRDIIMLGEAILQNYAALKAARNVLDYEDLIFKAKALLQSSSEWVQFKLDEGLDHILIDEAQDTNPEQWEIIEALCSEFFAAHSAPEKKRTLFTVGDEKQSIYSFQRASPEEFSRMQSHFSAKIAQASQAWSKVDLNISFRSTKSVLAAVDAVFGDLRVRKGLGLDKISHHAFRRGQAGLVELWPLMENDPAEKTRAWDPPVQIIDQKSGASKLAEKIAKTIRGWLDSGEELPSHDRAIQPGDIMILVRTRNAFTHQLIRALKLQKVPVGGLDRMVLNEQLAVQDLLAAAQISLLPSDDLTLACLLKSPLIGMDEEDLLAAAYEREGRLIDSLHRHGYSEITAYLNGLQNKAARLSPYEFFAHILQTPCPNGGLTGMAAMKLRLGIDALDAVDELLNAALSFERENIGSLQNFLLWQSKGEADIKREAEHAGDHVRIMTVHGSKGLQAPIVFLPDTAGLAGLTASKADNRLLWPTASALDLPLWAPRKDFETALYSEGKDRVLSRMDEEYRRLLYVAMTRAEDRLYVAGYKAKRELSEMCWYHIVQRGLAAHEECEMGQDGVLRLYNPQSKEADRAPKAATAVQGAPSLPAWLSEPAPVEPHPPAPLVPSRPAESEPSALSPLRGEDHYRFRRGNLTHLLLQFLPDLPLPNRQAAAGHYLSQNGQDLSEEILASILSETLKILDHPEFKVIFGPGSRAEVPITGLLSDGRLISGQIDRLLVSENEVLIVDYKTNRPPPRDPQDISAIYRRQMKAYADTLREIYPQKAIKCALLWTDGPHLMPIEV